jgi:hypothetical protein
MGRGVLVIWNPPVVREEYHTDPPGAIEPYRQRAV